MSRYRNRLDVQTWGYYSRTRDHLMMAHTNSRAEADRHLAELKRDHPDNFKSYALVRIKGRMTQVIQVAPAAPNPKPVDEVNVDGTVTS